MPESQEIFISCITSGSIVISLSSQLGRGWPPIAWRVYSPGGRANEKAPDLSVLTTAKGALFKLFFAIT